MKTKLSFIFECVFHSDKNIPDRRILVVADTFAIASSLAYSVAGDWDDFNDFDLCKVFKDRPIVVSV